jgi:hypothetical protein
MPNYFEAPDGYGESCVWMHTDNGPWCLLRKSDVAGTDRWPDVVARMTGTTITNPGERVPNREEHNAVQGKWDGGQPGNAAPMPATTTATPGTVPLTGTTITTDDAKWHEAISAAVIKLGKWVKLHDVGISRSTPSMMAQVAAQEALRVVGIDPPRRDK